VGFFALAAAAVALATPARANTYTITVDVSKQTAGNPHFWAAAVGTGTASLTLRSDLQTHYKLANRELGMMRVRGHGVLNDDIGIYKAPGSYDWTNFDKYLDAIVLAGMRPLMELDFMPTALALTGNSRDIYKDVNAYKQFIQAVVQHCIDRYGAADVGQWYWEVWNEPDYTGFWNGTNASEALAAKMTDYYTLYDNTVDAATAALPNIIIGGPVTTEPSKIAAFLQHCKSANKRVSFVSSHVYPGGAAAGASASATGLLNDNNTRLGQITSGGYTTAQVMSFNTEWNSSYSGQGGGTGDVVTSMDNNWNAAFILKGVKLLSDKDSGDTPPLNVFSYWVLSDIFDESTGPSGSYILSKNGTLPFGQVFGLMTFQGVRKAAFNAFKMLNYLGPRRLMSGGGTGGDGVDAMATTSAAIDEIQVLVYDTYATLNTTGTDMVTVTLNNLPSTLAGKQVFVTQFVVDETHSNPYSVWVGQAKPTAPSEAQWQQMKAAQHLALAQAVSTTTLSTTYSTSFTINRQGATLLILGVNRPVTGRNGLVELEAEDYDGRSGTANPEDSNDSATLGQSMSAASGAYIFYDNVDFSDAGVGSVQLRVNASAATTLELHADSMTGTLLGKCAVASTSGAWATQTCTITPVAGVHNLYALFGGTLRLNYMKFLQASGGTGTGGMGGGGTSGGSAGTTGTGSGGTSAGTGGSVGAGTGGGVGTGSAGTTGTVAGDAGTTGTSSGAAGTTGAGTAGTNGSGTGTAGSGTGSGGTSGGPGAGGSAPISGGGKGCACGVGDARGPAATLPAVALVAAALALRGRKRPRRRG
jgi:xylan 1,4-beta-xylosidase